MKAEGADGFAADAVIAQMVGAFVGNAGCRTGSGPQHRDDLIGAELQHGDVAVALQGDGALERSFADLGNLPVNTESLDDLDEFAGGAKAESMRSVHRPLITGEFYSLFNHFQSGVKRLCWHHPSGIPAPSQGPERLFARIKAMGWRCSGWTCVVADGWLWRSR